VVNQRTADKINRRLSTIYGNRWKAEMGAALFSEFKDLVDDADYSEAIRRHVHDANAGKFPPIPADLERHLQVIYVEREQGATAEVEEWFKEQARQAALDPEPENHANEPVTQDLVKSMMSQADLIEARAEQWRKERQQYLCYDCVNTGTARFWWDGKDRKRVWTRSEYMQLSGEEKEELLPQLCVCDCSVGQSHPHRSLISPVEYTFRKGPRRGETAFLPTWPRLEILRKLATQRVNKERLAEKAA